jgi:hypothetical protein
MGADRTGSTIYFIQGTVTKNIKIGRTVRDIQKRLNEMQSSDPLVCLKITKGDKDDERLLHDRFKHAWSHGEWFKPTPDLLNFIDRLHETPHSGTTQSVLSPWASRSANVNRKWQNGVFLTREQAAIIFPIRAIPQ